MSAKTMLLGAAAAGLALTPIAASAQVAAGLVTASSGDAYVSRDGRLLRAAPSMTLVKGDRVVTRANGSAKVAMTGGCEVAVGGSEIANVGSCETAGFDRAGYEGDSSALRNRDGDRRGAGTFIVPILGLAIIIVGILIAVDVIGDDDDGPVSA